MNDNYIAYSSDISEHQTFETFEEAEKWLREGYVECMPEDASRDYIAKITHRAKFVETDNIQNYPCLKFSKKPAKCDDCDEVTCKGTEPWPYDSDWDYVGQIEFEEQK